MSVATLPYAPAAPSSPAEVSALFQEAITEAFLDADADNPHDPGTLTMSGLGACTRRAAYQMAGYRPSNPGPQQKRAAFLGTAIDEAFLPRLRRVFGGEFAVIHEPATLRTPHGDVSGTLDLDTVLYAAATRVGAALADLKTVSSRRFDKVRAAGRPFYEHLAQVIGYALGRVQAGFPVRWVVFIYMSRDTGETYPLTVELTAPYAELVFDRVKLLRGFAAHPDLAPRDERGPGLSRMCDECPFLARCWGPHAVPGVVGAQRRLAHSDPLVVEAARQLAAATAAASEWDALKEFWKAVLGEREGDFLDEASGARAVLKLRQGALRLDQGEATRMLEARGLAVPRARNRPSLSVRVVEPV